MLHLCWICEAQLRLCMTPFQSHFRQPLFNKLKHAIRFNRRSRALLVYSVIALSCWHVFCWVLFGALCMEGFEASSSDLITPIKSVAFSENTPSHKVMHDYRSQSKWGWDMRPRKRGRDIWLCCYTLLQWNFTFHWPKNKIQSKTVHLK